MTASAKEVISDAIHLPSARKCDEYATAILAALDAAGYVVVPREPTEAMTIDGLVGLVEHITQRFPIPPAKDGEILSVQQAAERYMAIGSRMRDGREVNACYRAMIAAQEKQG